MNLTLETLSARQQETLRAVVDRIIPPDAFPGGWEAGVGDYLLRQLSRGDLQDQTPTYRAGLDALDAEAKSLGEEGAGFAERDTETQDALLARVAAGTVAATEWGAVTPPRFFRLLVEHAQEGFYGDPGNGGNRDGVSWRMVGFTVRG